MIDILETSDLEGLEFHGCPPKVASVSSRRPLHDLTGQYVTSIRLPGGPEVSGFSDVKTLLRVLEAHESYPIQLVVSPRLPTYICNDGLLYRYDIPTKIHLGLAFNGFPAKVVAVDKRSPFYGKILPEHFVESIVVPGYDDLTFDCGGFTGHRVSQYLNETIGIEGRQIIVKDSPMYATETPGSPEALMRSTFWRRFRLKW